MIIRPRERQINFETVVVIFTKVVSFMVDKDRWCLRRLGQENTSIQRVNTNTGSFTDTFSTGSIKGL